MRVDKPNNQANSKDVSRRDFAKKWSKVADVTPLVLTAVTAAERPAHAGTKIADEKNK